MQQKNKWHKQMFFKYFIFSSNEISESSPIFLLLKPTVSSLKAFSPTEFYKLWILALFSLPSDLSRVSSKPNISSLKGCN